MTSRTGMADDPWLEVVSETGAEEKGKENSAAQIAVVYTRRRGAEDPGVAQQTGHSSRERRVSFAAPRRTSWNRSLSIRGRTSIAFVAGVDYVAIPRQKNTKKIPKPGLSKKKAGPLCDFRKEKAYFEEVDAVELLEESPSPKHFGSWAVGKHDIVVHDLPAILQRWRISKLAQSHSCLASGGLFRIMETPIVESSCSEVSDASKSSEISILSGIHGSINSYHETVSSKPSDKCSTGNLDESSILKLMDVLHITEDNDQQKLKGVGDFKDAIVELKKESLVPRSSLPSEECESALTQLLMVCRQAKPLALGEVFSQFCTPPTHLVKIGEGTYGEAFKAGENIFKIVPMDGDSQVNGEIQKRSDEVLEEVMLSLTLNNLRMHQGKGGCQNTCKNFIEAKDFCVCQGSYSADLIDAWEKWDAKNGSENDHPKDFPKEQLYIVFVLADGGRDLENFVLLNFDEARSLLLQVSAALAVAEVACEFEHRDLHWGNLLLCRDADPTLSFTIEGRKMQATTFGLLVSIIDFTLSRINTGEAILFLDLSSDPGLFEGPKGDVQFETYRKMKEVTDDCWEGSFPKTNVLWLQYLVDILLLKKSFKRSAKEAGSLRSLKKRLSSYDSAKVVLSDNFFSEILFELPM